MALGDALLDPKNNKTSIAVFLVTIPLALFAILFLLFYISVNTIFAERTIPFLRVENDVTFFTSEKDLKNKIDNHIQKLNGKTFTFVIDGKQLQFKGSDLNLTANADKAVEFGKGSFANLISAYGNVLTGEEVLVRIDVDLDLIISNFSVKDINTGIISTGFNLDSCTNDEIYVQLDRFSLSNDINNQLRDSNNITLNSIDYIKPESDKTQVSNCLKFKASSPFIDQLREKLNISSSENIIDFDLEKDGKWKIISNEKLLNKLNEYKVKIDTNPSEGVYEIKDNKVYLLEMYSRGNSLNLNDTISSLDIWLENPNKDLPFVFNVSNPEILNKGLEILDFTQIVSVGETRMNIETDNRIGQAYNAYVGLKEIHNQVLNPGEEFSFFSAIGAHGTINEWTKNGDLIAIGICTSVTTLFRSVLYAGLPVTYRDNHAEYVKKYKWNPAGDPSEMDLMDATFYAVPGEVIDFKFKNDFVNPILIRTEVSYNPSDNYQYHKVFIRTSSEQTKRDVSIGNYRIWDFVSNVKFNSAFDRIVKEGDQTLIQETYTSDYQWGY